jgi:hypothetical protein|tara:strand:+ start:322 stop:570 length:249 start_codon:yes stop_codon:yes gene_type:complete
MKDDLKRDRFGRPVTGQQYISADPTILRTRTCRYILSLVRKCIKAHDETELLEIEKIRSELDYIERLIKKEIAKHPSTRFEM